MLLYYITDRHAFPGTEAEKRVRLLAKIAEAARCGVDFIQLREKDLSPRELERLAREAVQAVRDHTARPTSANNGQMWGTQRVVTRILINSRVDIALAVEADGVHLTSNDIDASDARAMWGASKGLTSAAKAADSGDVDGTAEAVPFPNSQKQSNSSKMDGTAKAVPFPNSQKQSNSSKMDGTAEAVPCPNSEHQYRSEAVPCPNDSGFVVGVSCHTVDEVRCAEAQGADLAVFAPVFEKKVREGERGRDVPATAAGTAALRSERRDRDITLFSRSNEEGLAALKPACQGTSRMPVLALGGITLENARDCIQAGAAGIAAIRLFQDNDIAEIVSKLRG